MEAIEAGKTIDKLFIQKGLHNDLFAKLWKLVRLKRINYKHVPLEKINRLTKKNHQGVFAFISPNFKNFSSFFFILIAVVTIFCVTYSSDLLGDSWLNKMPLVACNP